MKIALFGNELSQSYIMYIKHLVSKLEEKEVELTIHHQFYDFLQNSINFSENVTTYLLFLVFFLIIKNICY